MTKLWRVFLIWCFAGLVPLLTVAHAQEFDLEKVLKEYPEIRLAIEQKIIDQQSLKNMLTLFQQGRYGEAIPLVEEVLKKSEKVFGLEHAFTADIQEFLATVYAKLGKYDQAESLQKQALEVRQKLLGPEHPQTVTTIYNLAQIYFARGFYDQALPLFQHTLQSAEKALGPEHPQTADSLHSLAVTYYNLGEHNQALPLHQRALKIREKVLGPEHPLTVISLNNTAETYQSLGAYDKALPLYQRALQIHEKNFGPEHPNTVTSLNNLGLLYQAMGAYDKALPLHLRALNISEKVLGSEHAFTATNKEILGAIYIRLGKYDQGEPLLRQALDIRLKIFGPDHLHTLNSIFNLNRLYYARGAYDKAQEINVKVQLRRNPEILEAIKLEILDQQLITKIFELDRQDRFTEAIPIVEDIIRRSEKKMGEEHPFVAKATDYLAKLYSSAGDPKALDLNLKALKLLEKSKGPDHPDVATSLYNLAIIYEYMGDYIKAIELHFRALSIRYKSLGANHFETADSFNKLGGLFAIFNDLEKAGSFYHKAFLIRSKVFGPDHPITASIMGNIANIFFAKGKYKEAEEIYKKVLTISENSPGASKLDISTTLINLAGISYISRDYRKANELYDRALKIRKEIFGENHWRVYEIYNYLFNIYCANNEINKAYETGKFIIEKDDKLIGQVFGLSSEFEKMMFIYKKRGIIDSFISLVYYYYNNNQSAKEVALTAWLNRKGIVLEALRSVQDLLKDTDNFEAKTILQELNEVRVQLSNMIFSNSMVDEQKYLELESRKEKLESEISKISYPFEIQEKNIKVDVKSIIKSMPPNSVLIEIAEVQLSDFKDKPQGKARTSTHYMAFIISAKGDNKIDLIDLGETDKINKAITNLRKIIIEGMEYYVAKMTYSQFIESSRQTCALVFDSINSRLNGIKNIFISPDGNLNLLPFEILVGKDGRFLIEHYAFNYLATGKDIIRFGQIKEQPGKYILIGDPDFNLGLPEKREILSKMGFKKNEHLEVALRSADFSGMSFKGLPATEEEVKTIRSILGDSCTELFVGKLALEEVLHEMKSPRILHLATHGFYLGDQEKEGYLPPSTERGVLLTTMPAERIRVRIKAKNPLLLSGFVLSGANVSLKNGSNDGIVTAEKVAGLRLWGTDMVVLSACSTGLGDVRYGEGIFGLRRAFSMAGAKSLVMSMWKVPDKETQELMVAFYKNLKAGMDRCQALRQAAFQQKQVVKERYGHANPLYWGGFIFSGEP